MPPRSADFLVRARQICTFVEFTPRFGEIFQEDEFRRAINQAQTYRTQWPPTTAVDPKYDYPTEWVEGNGNNIKNAIKKWVREVIVDDSDSDPEPPPTSRFLTPSVAPQTRETSVTTDGRPSDFAIQRSLESLPQVSPSLEITPDSTLRSRSSSVADFHPTFETRIPTQPPSPTTIQPSDDAPKMSHDEKLDGLIKALTSLSTGGTAPTAPPYKSADLGYFWPDAPITTTTIAHETMYHTEGKTYYRDVNAFCIRIENACTIRNWESVRHAIDSSLLGEAHTWWNTAVPRASRKGCLGVDGLEDFVDLIKVRFRPAPSKSLDRLVNTRYTVPDCRAQRGVSEYIGRIQAAAQACGFASENAAVIFAWKGIDIALRKDIPEPHRTETLTGFTNTVLSHQSNWFDQFPELPTRGERIIAGAVNRAFAPQRPQGQFVGRSNNQYQRDDNYVPRGRPGQTYSQTTHQFKNPVAQQMYQQNSAFPTNVRDYAKGGGSSNNSTQLPRQQQAIQQSAPPSQLPWRQDQRTPQQVQAHVAEGGTFDILPDGTPIDHSQDVLLSHEEQYFEDQRHGEEENQRTMYQADPQDDGYGPVGNVAFNGLTMANDFLPGGKPPAPKHYCHRCNRTFTTRNRLFDHIEKTKHTATLPIATAMVLHGEINTSADLPERFSTAPPTHTGTGMNYRGFTYTTALVRLSRKGPLESGGIDSGCGASIVDRAWLTKMAPEHIVRKMAVPLTINGVGPTALHTDEYSVLTVRVPSKDLTTGKDIESVLTGEFHIVEKLACNMLMGTDIMQPHKMKIDFESRKMTIGACNSAASIEIRRRPGASKQFKPVHVLKSTIIPAHSMLALPVHSLADLTRDMLFEPAEMDHVSLYSHLVDGETTAFMAKNDTDKPVQLKRGTRLGHLHELDGEEVYASTAFVMDDQQELADMAEKAPRRRQANWVKQTVATLATAFAALKVYGGPGYSLESVSPKLPNQADCQQPPVVASPPPTTSPPPRAIKPSPETVLENGITVHGESSSPKVQAIAELCAEFPDIFKDSGTFVNIPPDEWMSIPLRSDWESRLPAKGARSYPPSPKPEEDPKGRVVVDIRGLNQLGLSDVYPIPLQADIIGAVAGCEFITVVDCASFFYQWPVVPEDRHKLTVVSHRGQEQFKVAVMGYKNSVSYVQRQIDRILRPYRNFARAYIDDVVVFSKTLKEHIEHLRQVFEVFRHMRISIKPTKAFMCFPSVRLLGQYIDSFGLASAEDKLLAISQLQFPATLQKLENFLGLTGWLRQYVDHYAALAQPLQDRKTELLRKGPVAGSARRHYTEKTKVDFPTAAEKVSFEELRMALSTPTYLVHHNPARELYIDVDSSKEFGMGAMVYHVKAGITLLPGVWPKRTDVEPILFLSRSLNTAEKNYWPTELEVAGLVWAVRKTKHLVQSSLTPTKVFTDHGAITNIIKQRSMETSSTDRANLLLIRASNYLQQFEIDCHHKPGKEHTVPDALSRLASAASCAPKAELDFDSTDSYNFTASMVNMSAEFRSLLLEGYDNDPFYVTKKQLLIDNAKLGENQAQLPFMIDDGLFYHLGDSTRLCVPESLVKVVLNLEHTNKAHHGFERTYKRAQSSWYIHHLARHVRTFIKECPDCSVMGTRRHMPYGSLQPIETPPCPFHTITIDFILALPKTKEGFDAIMSTTDKFTKRVTLIPGKKNWTAAQWANALIDRLYIADWGMPKVIISDRDSKFLSALWNQVFVRMGVSLLFSTAYHPQTDGASERTNQSVEISLRYYMASLEDETLWPGILPEIQAAFNNSVSAATTKTPNETVYGFTPNFNFNLSQQASELDFPRTRMEVSEAIELGQIAAKISYDRKHSPMFLATGDWALLRLHKGYKLPSATNKKLSQQYAGPFQVTERIGRLAYRLDIPEHWKIHNVFTIAQLEPTSPPGSDPYDRPLPDMPEAVDASQRSWEVEKILNKYVYRKGKGWCTKYLVRWLGYGPEYDEKVNARDLNCDDLIQKYEDRVAATNWGPQARDEVDLAPPPRKKTHRVPKPPRHLRNREPSALVVASYAV